LSFGREERIAIGVAGTRRVGCQRSVLLVAVLVEYS
jgi:hypothetical protein